MELTSTSFQPNQPIPAKYTCDGEDISPQFSWNGVPEETKSFALICTDPDAPSGMFTHWIVYNIPSLINEIQEGTIPDGALQAENDFRRLQYGGPCPPSGTHRYFFTLYALDVAEISGNGTEDIVRAIHKRAIEKVELVGLYQRKHTLIRGQTANGSNLSLS